MAADVLTEEPTRQRIAFGDFELDPRTGELLRDGVAIPLAPQPIKLLLALAERPGEAVTRDELQRRLWPDGTFVDFERGLNFCVLQARTALGDDAKNPRYIQTLPKRGYRLIAPVRSADLDAPKPADPRVRLLVVAILALCAVAYAVTAALQWSNDPHPPPTPRIMIAVLPFVDHSGGRDAHFASGMSEELLTHLGRLQPSRLGVIARTSVERYASARKPIAEIGRELGVQYVVEGSVRRDGDRVRISVQLVETRDQAQRWAESFDRSTTGALAVQQEIAAEIARALRIRLLDSRTAALVSTVPEAHEAYLKGRHLWNQRRTEDVEAGLAELKRAVALDPNFALAWVALAEAEHTLASRERIGPAQAATEIRRASDTALRLAPDFAQAHAVAALRHFWYDWDWAAAESSFRRATSLNPSEAGAHHDHGWLLISRGSFEDGIAAIRRAQELDPLSPRANAHVAWAYIYTRHYHLAVQEARRALLLDPEFREAYVCMQRAYELAGDFPSALVAYNLRRKLEDRPQVFPGDARAFLLELRLKHAASLEADAEHAAGDPYGVAAALAFAGEKEKALGWLEKAKALRSVSFPLAGVDPMLASLHGDARYEELLRSVGLQPVGGQATPSVR